MRRAQIKMFETMAVLVIFFFLLVGGAAFYFQIQKSSIKRDLERQEQLRAFQVVQKALFLPELDCSFVSIQKDNCFDKLKVINLQELLKQEKFMIDYFNVFGFSEIKIMQLYPVNDTFSYTLYQNIPEKYKSVISTQSPILLFDAVQNRYNFGVVEVDVYAEEQ
ncbi:hypothetical protein KY346_02995 [Candidatus Woesearchaeota archaeon]|nr:hypothetical protein [Candidatus Woesearchaeota archaeon]